MSSVIVSAEPDDTADSGVVSEADESGAASSDANDRALGSRDDEPSEAGIPVAADTIGAC